MPDHLPQLGQDITQVWPVLAYVYEFLQPFGEVVLVMRCWMGIVMIRVVVSEDVVSALVTGVVRILHGVSVPLRVDHGDLEILVYINDDVSVAKEFSRDQAALWGDA